MPDDKKKTSSDAELKAIVAIIDALEGLEGDALQRVIAYVFNRLSISTPSRLQTVAPSIGTTSPSGPIPMEGSHRLHTPSIRDLKEQKKPESSNQMAAIVAYYLSEVAGAPNGKQEITTADVEKYFKQAGFKLPQKINQTLPNAAAAGYLEAAGGGMYRLNPVGYNLVVHGLPRPHAANESRRKRAVKKVRNRRRGK